MLSQAQVIELPAAAFKQLKGGAAHGERLFSDKIGHWVRRCPDVPADMLCEDLLGLFRSRTELDCVAICDEARRPIGVMMKHRFFRMLGLLYGMSLFGNKTIAALMDPLPLTVDIDVQPQLLIDRALSRDDATFYDAVLVTESGRFSGMLTVSDVLHISRLLQRESVDRQMQTVRSSEVMMQGIHQAIDQLTEAAEDTRDCSNRIEALTERGRTELEEMLQLFRQWSDNALLQDGAFAQLTERAAAADQIVRLIADLADQCNLLAVNAAIEAARAGEHGKGFGVVADEVRGLADQTKRSAGQINRLLKTMTEAVERAASLVQEGKRGADRGVAQVKDTEETFGRLWESSKYNLGAIGRLMEASREAGGISDGVREEFGKLIAQMNGDKLEVNPGTNLLAFGNLV